MGYYMEQIGQDFAILAENKSKAFEALKRWEQEMISSYSYPLNILPLGDASTLEEALNELNWEAETDDHGNIVGLWFRGGKLYEEDVWLDKISAMVQKGSKIKMQGEDGHIWCWYFDGEGCVTYNGEIVFPGIPK